MKKLNITHKLFALLVSAILVTGTIAGCGSSKSSESFAEPNSAAASKEYAATDDFAYDEELYSASEEADGVTLDYTASEADDSGITTAKITPEMLVYRCSMGIDTTDFDYVVAGIKDKVVLYGGFIESERLYDNARSNGDYIVEKTDRIRSYTVTVRIPSANYNSFVSSTEGLGILNSKTATVDDVSKQYGTLKSTLEIYEADYERTMKEYEEAEEDVVRMYLQSELRDMALEIASIKTSMSSIESDVAYSYVTISVDEYLVLPEPEIVEPEPEPTFWTRLKDENKESIEALGDFLEGLLFFVVRTWWGFLFVIILGLVIFAIVRLIIRACKKSAAKRRAKEQAEIEAREAKRREEIAKVQAKANLEAAKEAAKETAKETVKDTPKANVASEKNPDADKK